MLSHISSHFCISPAALFRSFTSLNDAVLTRDFIKDCLYNTSLGYSREKKYGVLEKPIEFASLWGKWEFNKTIRDIYQKQGVNYMNAVELFTPTFSESIVSHIIGKHKLGTPLTIMEVSNGSTTNMCAMLRYMKEKVPNVYKNMKYYLLTDDIYFKSLPIPEEFADRITIKSIADKEKCTFISDSAFIIMNDILSGLPHDKVRVRFGSKGDLMEQYEQCVVVQAGPNRHEEIFMPISDPLIRRYISVLLDNQYSLMTLAEHVNVSIDTYNKATMIGKSRATQLKKYCPNEAFIPTVCFDLLEKVRKLATNCHFVAYDFDYLPACAEGDLNSPINCINGPIVCNYDSKGNCHDSKSHLENMYLNDIFFSTDFITLSSVIKTITGNDANIIKLNNFMEENSKIIKTRTMLGWNPLVKDFKNLSFLLS